MPSLRDLLLDWQRGVQAVARGDWGCALRLFSGVPGPPAKMCFNMGCVHLLAGDPEAALRAFDQAVAKDVYLAVGFFQRGVANFQLERSQEALSDFQVALAQLRGNSAIDYTQLGLHFKLQAWEVLFNVAATQCRLGLWAEAARSLEDAVSKGPEGARRDLGGALAQVQEQGTLQPRSVPRGEVFRPLRQHLEHLKPMDFLGKAKVVVASGTGPQQPQVPDQGWGARPRAGPRAHDTGPRGVSTPLGPRTPPSAAMEVGSGQAAGRADHHVPDTEAEQRPHREQAGQQAPVGRPAAGRPDRESSEDPPQGVAVTVQCAFTLALEAPRGASLSSLRALLCKALPAQARCGQLRWAPLSPGRGHRGHGTRGCGARVGSRPQPWPAQAGSPLLATLMGPFAVTESLVRVGAGSPCSRGRCRSRPGRTRLLALQGCSSGASVPLPQAVDGRPVLCQVVAQHSYSAERPEDLDLQPGDAVDVLCEGGAGGALSPSPAGATGAGRVWERTWHQAPSPAVDRAWLEGHCDGRVGIFPKCFVVPAGHLREERRRPCRHQP
ncbi:NADPH oxidase activator 1 isoform X2 [Artibeus jamaicensis]|uniref:NADPH oxidase activator 1 isoform X2 n=1 Tax=Artibeus jamaicensis TaxID=9417 RepID=UPI00235AB568|nr:NADPH oxidase activator 1 isoform X2 [Artibeus jamaicensis]